MSESTATVCDLNEPLQASTCYQALRCRIEAADDLLDAYIALVDFSSSQGALSDRPELYRKLLHFFDERLSGGA